MERYDIIIEGQVRIHVQDEDEANAEAERIANILRDLAIAADCWDEDDDLLWEVGHGGVYNAEEYASRREALMMGYCERCRVEPVKVKPNGDGYVRCEACHEQAAGLQRARQRRRREAGICTRCGGRQAEPGRGLCHECAETQRRAQVGDKPRKWRRVPVDEDDGLIRERTQEDQAIWDAHKEAINVLIRLGNARQDDPELRRAVRALYSSGALLAEAMG